MRYLKKSIMLAAVLVLAACASSGTSAAASQKTATTLVVDNQALMDMTIYALRGSQRVRLGMATGLSKTRMTIPANLVFGATSLRFLADPIGSSRTPVSEEITVLEGEQLELRIPPAL